MQIDVYQMQEFVNLLIIIFRNVLLSNLNSIFFYIEKTEEQRYKNNTAK